LEVVQQKKPARCRHGLIEATCATCSPPRVSAAPAQRRETSHSAGAVPQSRVDAIGLVVVNTSHRRDQVVRHGIEGRIDETTVTVHINGHPFLWAFEEILSRAPRLKVIQVIPSMLGKCHQDSHYRLCRERGVGIKAGHVRPEMVWTEDRVCSKHFDAQRKFLATMTGPQRALFDELDALGFEAAAIVRRYYGLGGEERMSQRLLALEYGYGYHNASISGIVLGVLHYLDDTTEVGIVSRRRAVAMKNKVARLRAYVASTEGRAKLVRDLGFEPCEAFPLARVEVLKALLEAQRSGKLAALAQRDPRAHQALTLRFGFDGEPGKTYRVLTEVGEMMGGVTRERARQLEERALGTLNILED
jgi:Sigma-70, region 4